MQELILVKNENLVVSSRTFAEGFDIQHKNLMELIKTHQETIESNFTEPFPFTITKYTKWIDNFFKMHKDKGCNKTQLDSPEWAAKDVNFKVDM